ncbi:MAG: hypothetical protein QXK24_01015 [Ignisphaera sp.]
MMEEAASNKNIMNTKHLVTNGNKYGENRNAVWEEALIQEFLYAIGHLNHCEQHLIEIDSSIGLPLFGDIVNKIREQRKIIGETLFLIEKLAAMKGSSNIRTSWESIWCTLKHLTTALIHVDECIEKLLNRIGDDSNGELVKHMNMLLRVRYEIVESLVQLLSRAKTSTEAITKASIRCQEDLCLEISSEG